MGESIEWVVDPARFKALQPAWDELARGPYEPFARHLWFETWWEAFGRRRNLCLCALWRAGELAAVMPLYAESQRRLASMANIEHSPLFHPLARDSSALDEVAAATVSRSSEVRVGGLPAESPALQRLIHATRTAGRVSHL